MTKNKYIKYSLNYNLISAILKNMKKDSINFFIDVNSIAKGFYNKATIEYEIAECIENAGVLPSTLIIELNNFLNNLYKLFKAWDPFFILFYDDGKCIQNRLTNRSYKQGRSINNIVFLDDDYTQLFRNIKQYYYNEITNKLVIEDLSSVFYLKEYESDFIPHYCIRKDLYDSNDTGMLNVILSLDKDLLQTCQFNNVIQCVTNFTADKKTGKFNINFHVFDKKNALSYIYKKFKPGILTAKHVPLVLALAGDKADDIDGIKGIGPAKAIKIIEAHSIPSTIDEIKNNLSSMPKIIQDNINIISMNMKLIDFDLQLKRTPDTILEKYVAE